MMSDEENVPRETTDESDTGSEDITLTPTDESEIQSPKKRRGRPPKNPEDTIKTEKIEDESPKAKPGPKKRNKGLGDEAIDLLARQLMGLHHMAAMITGLPVLILADMEAKMLANSVVVVANEYGLSLSGKTGAALQLVATAGMIYIPRLIEIKKMQAGQKPIDGNFTHANSDDQPG